MFDARRLLGQVLGEAMGGSFGGRQRKARGPLAALGVGKAQVGLGLLGLAFAAYEHYNSAQAAPTGMAPPGTAPMPLASPTAMPPPPPPGRPAAKPAAIEDGRA